jgi:two-component system sensor histidine kinase PhoQ
VAAATDSPFPAASNPSPATTRRALSLHARQLLAASLGLVAFLGLTGIALDRAFLETARASLHQRLQGYAYAYVSVIDFDRDGQMIPLPEEMRPDERFTRPGSGLYAQIKGEGGLRWESPSAVGAHLPEPPAFEAGRVRFDHDPVPYVDSDGKPREAYRLLQDIVWETGEVGRWREVTRFTFSVLEDTDTLQSQLNVFRRALWGYLGLAAILLLLVQTLVLRWSLHPLRRLERELQRVQRGVSARLSSRHPPELEQITGSVNALIESEHAHLDQSRNTLSDLAHSLKTPLAVLRSRLESEANPDELRRELSLQVQRMSEIVSYQLSRAARSGHALFAAPVEVEPRAEEIVASLEKVYAGRGVLCEFDIDPAARFYGELGDLQELLGNLLENAFKWAARRVLLTVRLEPSAGHRRPGLQLQVEDDGPGIAPDQVQRLLQRGVRGDERVQGHGIGLAIVQDIVHAYRGDLTVTRSEDLGGARFDVRFPAVF